MKQRQQSHDLGLDVEAERDRPKATAAVARGTDVADVEAWARHDWSYQGIGQPQPERPNLWHEGGAQALTSDGDAAGSAAGPPTKANGNGAALRTMRVTKYLGNGRRKTWVGSTTEPGPITYQWTWRDGDWDLGEHPESAGVTIWDVDRKTRKPTNARAVEKWAKGAKLVVIEIGESTEELVDAGEYESSTGDEEGPASAGGGAKAKNGRDAERHGDGEAWETKRNGSDDGTTAHEDLHRGDGNHNRGHEGPVTSGERGRSRDGITGRDPDAKRRAQDSSDGNQDQGGDVKDDKGTGTWAPDDDRGNGGDTSLKRRGADADGLAGGEENDAQGKGVPGATGWWGLIETPTNIAAVLAVAAILTDADIAGSMDVLVKKAGKFLKKGGRNALKKFQKEIRDEVEELVEKGMTGARKELEQIPDWQFMDDAAKASKLKQAENGLRDHVERRMIKRLEELADDSARRADEISEQLAEGAETRTSREVMDDVAGDLRDESREAAEAAKRLKEQRKNRLKEQGDGSFKEMDDVAGGATKADPDAAEQFKSIRGYWTDEVTVDGMKVYRRNDLVDPNRLDDDGLTSLQRMERGDAPIGPDGESMDLHHMNQSNEGPVAEMTATFHKNNHKTIHINDNKTPSGIDRPDFNVWKRGYWRERAKEWL